MSKNFDKNRPLVIAPSTLHQVRFVKNKVLGMSTEQIAKEEGILEKFVQKSVAQVEAYRAMNTLDALEASQVEVVLTNHKYQKEAIKNGLTARVANEVEKGGIKVIVFEPNHDVQLRTLEIMAKMTDTLVSSKNKGTGGNQNQVNIAIAGGGVAGVGISTFEDRLRKIKAERSGLVENKTLPASISEDGDEVDEVTPDWGEVSVEQGS